MDIKSCLDMPKIQNCGVTNCSYNTNGGCRTAAITVGSHSDPLCDTFYTSKHKGGINGIAGVVGACRQETCHHNQNLECFAPSGISVIHTTGEAQCATFRGKK